eukprot:m.132846 g.132846  ORF g.132846 m.132846 type:complete len:639 (+) comp14654_c0_seq2:345-2261(+)
MALLEQKLIHWAKALGFPAHSCTAEDLRLLCRGNMRGVWEQMMKSAVPPKEMQCIKDNINIMEWQQQDKQSSEKMNVDKPALFKEIEQVQREIQDIAVKIADAQRNLEQEELRIKEMVKKYRETMVLNSLRKAGLDKLSSPREILSNMTAYLEAKSSNRIQTMKKFREHKVYYDLSNTAHNLQSECKQAIEESLASVEKYLHSRLNGTEQKSLDDNLENPQKIETNKIHSEKEILNNIKDIYTDFSPEEVSTALVSILRDRTSKLKKYTDELDLKEDAKQLRFSMENGVFHDDFDEDNVATQSVREMLQDAQTQHLAKHFEARNDNNIASSSKKATDDLMKELSRVVSNNPEDRISLIVCQAKYAAVCAVISCLKLESEKLDEIRIRKEVKIREIEESFESVQRFREEMLIRQTTIQDFIKSQATLKERSEKVLNDAYQFCESNVRPQHAKVKQLTALLRNFTEKEDQITKELPIDCATFVPSLHGPPVRVMDMSIHRLESSSSFPSLELATNSVMKPFEGSDRIIPTLFENFRQNNHKQSLTKKMKKNSSANLSADAQLNDHDLHAVTETSQRTNLVSQYDELSRVVEKAICEAAKGQDKFEEWVDQPAQYLTPTLLREGLTLQQWMTKLEHIEKAS